MGFNSLWWTFFPDFINTVIKKHVYPFIYLIKKRVWFFRVTIIIFWLDVSFWWRVKNWQKVKRCGVPTGCFDPMLDTIGILSEAKWWFTQSNVLIIYYYELFFHGMYFLVLLWFFERRVQKSTGGLKSVGPYGLLWYNAWHVSYKSRTLFIKIMINFTPNVSNIVSKQPVGAPQLASCALFYCIPTKQTTGANWWLNGVKSNSFI